MNHKYKWLSKTRRCRHASFFFPTPEVSNLRKLLISPVPFKRCTPPREKQTRRIYVLSCSFFSSNSLDSYPIRCFIRKGCTHLMSGVCFMQKLLTEALADIIMISHGLIRKGTIRKYPYYKRKSHSNLSDHPSKAHINAV